ncbi:MAG: hypothetical protein AAFR61_13750 [Bacteroidota bacterium]
MRFVLLMAFIPYLFPACSTVENRFPYGAEVSLTGRVVQQAYSTNGVDTFHTYLLILEDSLTVYPAEPFLYGQVATVDRVHLDVLREEFLAWEGKTWEGSGTLIPSETSHHLGPVCLHRKE